MTEVPIEASPSTSARAVRLPEIARIFLKIGGMSYGVGIIGIMQSEVQEKRQWIGKEEFVEGLALVNMLPGPPGAQLSIFLGHAKGSLIGGILAGVCCVFHHARPIGSLCCFWRSSDHAQRLLWHRSCRRRYLCCLGLSTWKSSNQRAFTDRDRRCRCRRHVFHIG